LVGTVLSLWDAAELDAAGEDGEVLPKFINLTDASIKMVCAMQFAWLDVVAIRTLTQCNRSSRSQQSRMTSNRYKTS
jgi:hypothetical protein